MPHLNDLIDLIRRRRMIVMILLAMNILCAAFILRPYINSVHKASMQVVFQKPDRNLNNNRANDYLFESGSKFDHSEFLGELQSDTLMELTAIRFDLASHYGLDPNDPNAIKKAGEILRTRLEYTIGSPILPLSFRDENPEIAESVLTFLATNAKTIKADRVRKNHMITSGIAQTELTAIENDLASISQQIKTLQMQSPVSASAKSEMIMLGEIVMKNTFRRFELNTLIADIERNDIKVLYSPYETINMGVKNASKDRFILSILAIFGVLILQFLEMQVLLIVDQATSAIKPHKLKVADIRDREIRTGS